MVVPQKPILLDQYGNPVVREALTQRMASATITSIRQAVGSGVTRGLTPQRLAAILREAEDGDPSAYCELAEEMEEKDLHYLSVLGTRKRQISQLDMTIEPPDGASADDKAIAADVKKTFLDSGMIDDCLFDVLDAIGKGFSLSEIEWETRADKWMPRRIDWVDPRFVRFDRATRRIPLLLSEAGYQNGYNENTGPYLPLPPWKFIFCEIKAKSGLPLRSGLARPVAWAWMFKNFTIKDWVQFCDIYGIPLRLGKFAPGASDDDKSELLRAVASIAADAAAIVPNNMDISFVETKASGSSDGGVFGGLAKYFDDQISKAVLGQTGTTDSTPGKLGGTPDHTQVREDIERADAKALMACLNRQLIKPYVDLNYGPNGADGTPRNYPWLWIGRPEKTDAALMVDTAAKLPGLKVRAEDIRKVVGFTTPAPNDELLDTPPPASTPPGGNIIPIADTRPVLASRFADITNARALATSLAVELLSAAEADDPISRAVREQTAGWKQMMKSPVDQILNAAAAAKTPEEFREALTKLHGELDTNALAERLALMTFQAFGGGAMGDPAMNFARKPSDG